MPTDAEMLASAPDCDLVVRARSEREALGRLFDLYYPGVLRHCLRRLFVRCVAEDVTSEVFLQVARKIPSFDGSTHDDFLCWIHKIATNASNAYLRQSHRRAELLREAVERKAVAIAEPRPSSLELLDWPTAYQAILNLPLREQSIITLRYFQDLSHQQIAVILEMRPGTVRTALARAIGKLRDELGVEL